MRTPGTLLLAGLVALTGAACATDAARRDADRLALYRAHAGAPVDSFRFFGRLYRWTPLGDSAVAIWPRSNQAYLLDLAGPCSGLPFAHTIGVTDSINTVSARFDKVIVLDRHGVNVPCQIRQIRPLNVKALRAAERQRRART
jgi:hypothetical protein